MKGMNKIMLHKSSYDLLKYVFVRENSKQDLPGELIGGNMISSDQDISGFVQEFEIPEYLRQDIEKKLWHESLRLPPGETMSREKWVSFADEFMKRMGFDDNFQRLYILHDDVDKNGVAENGVAENGVAAQHIHIVASRISLDSRVHKSHDQNFRATKIIADLEKEFGLTITKGVEYDEKGKPKKSERRHPTRNELEKMKRTGQPTSKEFVANSIDAILKESKSKKLTFHEFELILKSIGIETIIAENKGGINGCSFKYDGVAISGSKLGDKYKWSKLSKNFNDLGISAMRSSTASRKRDMKKSIFEELLFVKQAIGKNRKALKRVRRGVSNPIRDLFTKDQLLVLERFAQFAIENAYKRSIKDHANLTEELRESLIRQTALEEALAAADSLAVADPTQRDKALENIRSELYKIKNGIKTKSKLANLLAQATRLESADDMRLLISEKASITAESIKLAAKSSDKTLLGLLKGALEADQVKFILASASIDEETKAQFIAAVSIFTEAAFTSDDALNKKFMIEKIREFLIPIPGELVITLTEFIALLNSQGIDVQIITTKNGVAGIVFKHDETKLTGSEIGTSYRWGHLFDNGKRISYDETRDFEAVIRCKPDFASRTIAAEVAITTPRIRRKIGFRNQATAQPLAKLTSAKSRSRSAAERSNSRRMLDVLSQLKSAGIDSFSSSAKDLRATPGSASSNQFADQRDEAVTPEKFADFGVPELTKDDAKPRRLTPQGYKKANLKAPDVVALDSFSSPDKFKSGIRKPVAHDPRPAALDRIRENLVKLDAKQLSKSTHQTLLAEATRLSSLDDVKLILASVKLSGGTISAEVIKLAAKNDEPIFMSLIAAEIDAERIEQMLKMRWIDDDAKDKLRIAVGMKTVEKAPADTVSAPAALTSVDVAAKRELSLKRIRENLLKLETGDTTTKATHANLLAQALRLEALDEVQLVLKSGGNISAECVKNAAASNNSEFMSLLKTALDTQPEKLAELLADKSLKDDAKLKLLGATPALPAVDELVVSKDDEEKEEDDEEASGLPTTKPATPSLG